MTENIVKNMCKDAIFTYVEDGIEHKTKCKVNMYTREVFNLEEDLGIKEFEIYEYECEEGESYLECHVGYSFYYQYVTIDGTDYYVINVVEDEQGWDYVYKRTKNNMFWYEKNKEDVEEHTVTSWWSTVATIEIDCEVNSHTHEILRFDTENIDEDYDEYLSNDVEYIDLEQIEYDDICFAVVPKSSLKYYKDEELVYVYWYDDDIHYTNHYKKINNKMYGYVDYRKPLTKCMLVHQDEENILLNNGNNDRSYKKYFDNYEDAYNYMLKEFNEYAKNENHDEPFISDRCAHYHIKKTADVFNNWMIVEAKN